MSFWTNFAAKHPGAAKWIREGGLFVIVSNVITVFKYILLTFLPAAFAGLPGYPGALAADTDGTLYISYPLSWALTAGVHLICLLVVRKKMNDQLKEESRLVA